MPFVQLSVIIPGLLFDVERLVVFVGTAREVAWETVSHGNVSGML